ncbi:MAG: winged helix DNA-binding protein [Rhodobacteraceae bacterium]|nr:winged helix DNA-binding protein [Paracoccaceae bacterium]
MREFPPTRTGGKLAMNAPRRIEQADRDPFLDHYLEVVGLVERLHRLLLDVIKDEFERLGILEINAVQGLMLFNIGENVVTAGELKTRGYYQGSNVSYNLKKLVSTGYMSHRRCEVDRRAVRVGLTDKGFAIRERLSRLFARHAEGIGHSRALGDTPIHEISATLLRMERYWADQIRYIY